MTLNKCVTSLVGVKRPYCLVGMLKMRREQRYSINCVFGTDYKRKTESAYGNKEIKKTAIKK